MRIARGLHGWNDDRRCTAEWRMILCPCERCAALRHRYCVTARPPCSPRTIAALVPIVNDVLDDEHRQRMVSRIPLIPSIALDADPDVVARVERRMARWLADSAAERAAADEAEFWAAQAEAGVGRHAAEWAAGAAVWVMRFATGEDPDALLDWLDEALAQWHKLAADEGLMGSCSWLDLDLDADPDEYTAEGGS